MLRALGCFIGGSVCFVGLVACGDDESTSGSGGAGSGGGPASASTASGASAASGATTTGTGGEGGATFTLDVAWEPCGLDSNAPNGLDAECALVDVPLDWDDPASERIETFWKRWPRLDAPASHHFWMIQGGPGVPSMEFEGRVATIGTSFPDAQFYFRDPRGVGRSTRLSCPGAEGDDSEAGLTITMDEWPGCIAEVQAEHGDDLVHFGTSAAARDLGAMIDETRGDAEKLTLFGSSYGTTLIQRYLHFFPDQVDLVVLDSLANPGFPFHGLYERADRVGHDYLELCADDAGCAARLGDDPSAFADETFATQLDGGGCAGLVDAGVDRRTLAPILQVFMLLSTYRPLIPAVFYRLARCSPADVDALTSLAAFFDGAGPPSLEARYASDVLYHSVIFSEAWPGDAESAQEHRATLADNELGSLDAQSEELEAIWPTYDEPLANLYPAVDVPMLMANGTLDTQTPIEEALVAADHYTLPTQTFITVPGAPHGAIGGEPWTEPTLPCTVGITEAFVRSPTEPLDVSCLDDIGPPSFEASADASELFFDTTDPWGDADVSAPPRKSPLELAVARAAVRDEIRRVVRR
jgi:pimeloyl-ACP methyl ester carboxylesterase